MSNKYLKIKLQDNINRHFANLRKCKYSTRKSEQKLLLKISEDLDCLGIELKCFKQLTSSDLSSLIAYWQKCQNKMGTIYNKLTVLKKHYGVSVDNYFCHFKIKNGKYCRSGKSLPTVKLSQIKDEKIRFLCEGQTLFGLTCKEVLNLQPATLCEGMIKVLRLYAFNGMERHIIVRTKEQQEWVSRYPTLIEFIKLRGTDITLLRKHRRLLQDFQVHSNYFRDRYILWRYYDLLSQYHCISKQSQMSVFAKFRQELGYQRNASLKEIIACQSKIYAMPLTACIN